MQGKQKQFHLGGEFVLATLAGNFYCEDEPLLFKHAGKHSTGYLLLVWTEFIYQ